MSETDPRRDDGTPSYEHASRTMRESRSPLGEKFAEQILKTTEPFRGVSALDLDVLDVGCGYGATSMALARQCRFVTGIDPSGSMIDAARHEADRHGVHNVEFQQADIAVWETSQQFDLIVLDNVFEHLPEQRRSLQNLCRCLKPGGVCYLLMPNRLWPIEVHYHLPFLSWLPLPLANRYLRWSGRGTDYTDASFAPTYGSLRRLLRELPGTRFDFVLPADLSLSMRGSSWTYRTGTALLRRCSALWWISKAFLVVLRKDAQ